MQKCSWSNFLQFLANYHFAVGVSNNFALKK